MDKAGCKPSTHLLASCIGQRTMGDDNTANGFQALANNTTGVRYDQVNAMLLNEFLKEHCQVQDLKGIVAEQQRQIEALTAGLQKISAQLAAASPSDGGVEHSKPVTKRIRRGGPAPRTLASNQ